jgi:hypothetical protein
MIIVVFGGLGSVTGTIGASFAWALILEGFLRLWLPQGFETWRFVVYPLLLLLVMLLKPKGLFGDFEMPFLRQILPPLAPTAAARLEEVERAVPTASGGTITFPKSHGDNPPAQETNE